MSLSDRFVSYSLKSEIRGLNAVFTNGIFLSKYETHVVTKWKHDYLNYDCLNSETKLMRQEAMISRISVEHFDEHFKNEIQRVHKFAANLITKLESDLQNIQIEWDGLPQEQKISIIHRTQADNRAERTLRALYTKIESILKFWKLNKFAMDKIGLKIDSLLNESIAPVHFHGRELESWADLICHESYNVFCNDRQLIDSLKKRCRELFSTFLKIELTLADSFLEYEALKDSKSKHTEILLGCKLGVCLAMMLLICYEMWYITGIDVWRHPAIYVYSAVGSIVLFKLMWCLSVFIWIEYSIDYISVFKVANNSPNLLAILNETMTVASAYFISLFAFVRSNAVDGFRSTTVSHVISPLVLIIFVLIFWIVKLLRVEHFHQSRGPFSGKVMLHCLLAPTYPVSFREGFAADALTSFNKIISDGFFSSCWLFVGAMESNGQNFDEAFSQCTSSSMTLLVAAGTLIPLWIRFAQCMRQFWDKNIVFPPIFNGIKYALSMLVVVYSVFGKGSSNSVFTSYYLIVVVATAYKWWWDVVMDWGLFWIVPIPVESSGASSSLLRHLHRDAWHIPAWNLSLCWLRPHLIFHNQYLYYAAIVVDLFLRFVWVLSLEASRTSFPLIPALSIFLGMLEVFRRSMWGILRVEYEYICSCMNRSLGVPEAKVFTYLFEDPKKT